MDYGYFHTRHWRDGGRNSAPGVGQVVVHDHDGNHDLYDLRGLGKGVFSKFQAWYEAQMNVTIWTSGRHMFAEKAKGCRCVDCQRLFRLYRDVL